MELIIVDANSNDKTMEIIDLYTKYIDVRLINVNSDCTIGHARQIGVDNSKGDIIAFVDSDVELPHEHWIKNMLKSFDEDSIAGVQTLAKAKKDDPAILKKIHSSFEYKNTVIGIDNYEPIGTSHLLIRKELINKVGGFKDISFKEDTDLTYRIMKLGYKFVYYPGEKCYHYHVKNYKEYVRKELRNKIKGAMCMLGGLK